MMRCVFLRSGDLVVVMLALAKCAGALTSKSVSARGLHHHHRALREQDRRRAEVSMRFGKKDVKIRSLLASMIEKASDTSSLDEVITNRNLKLANWRMQRRLRTKIRRRGAALGYPASELEDRLDAALSDGVPAAAAIARAPPPAPVQEAAAPAPVQEVAAPAPTHAPSEQVPIAAQVDAEVKVAMKAKDKVAVMTLRNIKTALASAAKDAGVQAVDDPEAIKVLRKLAKMRQESIDMYLKAGDSGADRAAAESAELDVIQRWLPQLASEDTVRAWIAAIIESQDGPPNKGKVMGALMKAHKDDLDGKMAGALAAEMCAAAAA